MKREQQKEDDEKEDCFNNYLSLLMQKMYVFCFVNNELCSLFDHFSLLSSCF